MKASGKKWQRRRPLFRLRDGRMVTDGSGHYGRAHRAKRRAVLAGTWSRVMAQVRHPVAVAWRAFCAKTWRVVRDGGSPENVAGWASFKKRARAVAR